MRHWVFDLDGTLVDSFDFYLNIVEDLFQERGIEFTPALRRECLGAPALPFLRRNLGDDFAEKSLGKLRSRAYSDTAHIQPFPGIVDHLTALASGGSRLAVWTSRDRGTTERLLDCAGLRRFMDIIVTGCCVRQHKPHPEGMQRIMTALGCAAHEITMVGDHDVDMHAARASGTRALRASWHRHDPHHECRIADGVLTEVSQLPRWFGPGISP